MRSLFSITVLDTAFNAGLRYVVYDEYPARQSYSKSTEFY